MLRCICVLNILVIFFACQFHLFWNFYQYVNTCAMLCMCQATDNLQVCILYFHYVTTRDQTEVVKFGSKCLKQVSDLTNFLFQFQKYWCVWVCAVHMSQSKCSNQRKTGMSNVYIPETELRSSVLAATTSTHWDNSLPFICVSEQVLGTSI